MLSLTARRDYNGFAEKIRRLGLDPLIREVEDAVTGFPLVVLEERHANGTRQIRQRMDDRFDAVGGWDKVTVGGVDWTKANAHGSRIGVEIQVSSRSDLLAVDVLHLGGELIAGKLDVGIIVVPDDALSRFLTDRTPNLRTARRHVEQHAQNMAIRILAFRHDGKGPAIPKARTNLGR